MTWENFCCISKLFTLTRCSLSVHGGPILTIKVILLLLLHRHPNGSDGYCDYRSPNLQSSFFTEWQPCFLLWVDNPGSLLRTHWFWLPVPLPCSKELIFYIYLYFISKFLHTKKYPIWNQTFVFFVLCKSIHQLNYSWNQCCFYVNSHFNSQLNGSVVITNICWNWNSSILKCLCTYHHLHH